MPESDDPALQLSVEEMYADGALSEEELEAILDQSLEPRGPGVLLDLAGDLGIASTSEVLDLGCRDGRHLLDLHRRFGCRGTGIDPVAANLARAPAEVRDAPVTLVRAIAESLPFAGASFDLVWVRDVLIHIEALAVALSECRRVLRPGAAVLVFQMFATPWLEPGEAARLWPPLAAVPKNLDRAAFEEAIAESGLRIEHRDELRSEWREYLEEHESGRTSRQLLWAARLLRSPERYRAAIGARDYAIELSNCLWGVYQMIGKLSPVMYVLR
ncbi:MAG TPA: class I SAM-dependent methyltransferase [Acidimicrobiales bacterium]|nr:class I SAM-dependent methyltransferase [Acidimicrobiales bacterium]